jgi:predicted DNA-binding protein (MmcQ/YjbR family)
VKRRDLDAIFAPSEATRRRVPFDFVLEAISELGPLTKPMFGCTAVYIEEKIVFILRDRRSSARDNGVWVATTAEHHASLRRELPSLRSIAAFGRSGETGWQVLPAEDDRFEEQATRACELVLARDPRIGKTPKPRRPRPKERASMRDRTPVPKSSAAAVAEQALRDFALAYPDTHEDHPWGERAIKVKKKTFVFMSADANGFGMSCKLTVSLAAARKLKFASPTHYGLGKSGWMSAHFGVDEKPPLKLMKQWIDESFHNVAPKTVLAKLRAP